MATTEQDRLRARIARETKAGNLEGATQARTEYAVVKIEDYIRAVRAKAPPLSDEQSARLAALLKEGTP